MKAVLTFLSFIIMHLAFSQEVVQEVTHPGKFYKAPPCKIQNCKIDEVFEIISRLPAVRQPVGYDSKERFYITPEGKFFKRQADLILSPYYSVNGGPVKLQTFRPPVLTIYFNEPRRLMNFQRILYSEETISMGMPEMFTDTFTITYVTKNGIEVGLTIDTEFASNLRVTVINPRKTSFFTPITQEQYLKFWIAKLEKDIEKELRHVAESRKNLREVEGNAAYASTIPQLRIILAQYEKWVDFLKEKKLAFHSSLAGMNTEEKNAPAYFAIYPDGPQMFDKMGKPVEKITGRLNHELAGPGDTLYRKGVFTWKKNLFDPKLPASALQLIVILDPFSEDETHHVKNVLDKEFYPKLSYKDLAALMYK